MGVVISGLAEGTLLFLLSAGLTIMVGVLDLINLAYAGFFGIGAYVMYQIIGNRGAPGLGPFALGVIGACLGTLVLGLVAERLFFRRFGKYDVLRALLGTYGVLLMVEGVLTLVYSNNEHSVPLPAAFKQPLTIANTSVSGYSVLVLCVGVVLAVALELVTHRTEFGRQLTAVSQDRFAAELMGINVERIYAVAVVGGLALAGLGGALASPGLAVVPSIGDNYLITALAIIVIGGMGSVTGALVAAAGIGLADAVTATYLTQLDGLAVYIVLLVVLLARPRGLFARMAAT